MRSKWLERTIPAAFSSFNCAKWSRPGPPVFRFGERDSTNLILVDRRSARIDTAGRASVAERRFEFSESQFGGITTRILAPNPLAVKEPAALSADGWMAVGRRDPCRGDWRTPDGTTVRGQPLPHERVRVDDAEKAFVMAAWAAERDGRRRDPTSVGDWPQYYPPYSSAAAGTLLLAGDGKAVVRRPATRRMPHARYDVLDCSGRLAARVALPPAAGLVGLAPLCVRRDSRRRWTAEAFPSPVAVLRHAAGASLRSPGSGGLREVDQ